MDFLDLSQLAFSNLWRTKLRSLLTILGVVIGIGALTSMISLGIGMQKNITEAFDKNDLFTSLNVTVKNIGLKDVSSPNITDISEKLGKSSLVLTDSVVDQIRNIPEVVVAFPEIRLPVRLRYQEKESNQNLSAVGIGMKAFYPFSAMKYGSFFSSDSAYEIILNEKTLEDLGFVLSDHPEDTIGSHGKTLLYPDSLINSKIDVISKEIDIRSMLSNPFMAIMRASRAMPFRDTIIPFTVKGIVPNRTEFGFDRFGGGVIVPLETSKKIPNLGFNSVWDLLEKDSHKSGYGSIYVRVNDIQDTKAVADSLEKKGLNVFAFSEELKEIKRAFMIMDSLLGAIGLIALVVAALGIINTMLMSIFERTREIGIMKSIGGSEGEIKTIFFVEASTIGIIGAIFGLGLGWVVTRIANVIMNSQIRPQDLPEIEMFYFPWWLILGSIVFSIIISLAAGLYPAIRAARIDPVKALRHD